MNLMKVRFLKDSQPTGKSYTYYSPIVVKPGDIVQINSTATGVVVEVGVPEEEVAAFADKVKSINGLIEVSQYGAVESVIILNDIIGKTFIKVENINNEELVFTRSDGARCIFYHEQDCCESVMIEDICGDLSVLENSPITMAEEICHENMDDGCCESQTYTFYKFATLKGYVTVRWRGSSNCYYSENVDFKIEESEVSANVSATTNQCCGTCAYHVQMAADEFSCDKDDSEGYGLSTTYDDCCDEYKEREE